MFLSFLLAESYKFPKMAGRALAVSPAENFKEPGSEYCKKI